MFMFKSIFTTRSQRTPNKVSSPFSQLPGLIIRHILSYIVGQHYIFKHSLMYLAICSNWRHAALPLIYRTLYFVSGSVNLELGTKYYTNLELYKSLGNFQLAQHLYINSNWSTRDRPFKQLTALLLIMNSQKPVQMPSTDYQDPLVLEIVESVIQNFVQKFNSIHHLQLHNGDPDYVFRHFNRLLVNSFSGRLRHLTLKRSKGGSLTYISDTLTTLTYECGMFSFPLIPKLNIEWLKKLDLSFVPSDFSWALFQNDPVVEFSNLEVLYLGFASNNDARISYAKKSGIEIMAPDTQVDVRFPRLRTFSYNNMRSGFVFMPKIISAHLDFVHLNVSWAAFCDFTKLPITSISILQVVLYNFVPGKIQACYRAANRFFNAIENPGNIHLSFNESNQISLEQVCWKNVSSISLWTTDIRELVCMVCNMPQIEKLSVSEFKCMEFDDDQMLCLETNGSRLKELSVWKLLFDGIPKNVAVEEFVKVLSWLKHLHKVLVSKDIYEKVQIVVEKYPGLKELEITDIF